MGLQRRRSTENVRTAHKRTHTLLGYYYSDCHANKLSEFLPRTDEIKRMCL